jgi:hypothetical protein
MRQRSVMFTAAMSLVFTGVACGGDDAGGGGSLQAQVANELIAEASADSGITVDESCVRRVTGELSNADARALLDDSEEDLSAEGGMALLGIFECFDFDFGDLEDFDFDLDVEN